MPPSTPPGPAVPPADPTSPTSSTSISPTSAAPPEPDPPVGAPATPAHRRPEPPRPRPAPARDAPVRVSAGEPGDTAATRRPTATPNPILGAGSGAGSGSRAGARVPSAAQDPFAPPPLALPARPSVTASDVTALLLISVGAFLAPVLAPVIGLLLLWRSRGWPRPDKGAATAVVVLPIVVAAGVVAVDGFLRVWRF